MSSQEERWCPISIMLSMYGSKISSKLLFRYPFDRMDDVSAMLSYTRMTASTLQLNKKQPSSLSEEHEDCLKTPRNEVEQIESFSDELLAQILSPINTNVCGKKFDLKINGIRFVGFPISMEQEQFVSIKAKFGLDEDEQSHCQSNEDSTLRSFNIVFVLRATSEYAIVEIYQELSLQLGIALRFEEKRCQYVSEETRLMLSVHDEDEVSLESETMATPKDAYNTILNKSGLARQLSKIFDSLRDTGIINTRINDSTLVSFCLLHKVHNKSGVSNKAISIDSVKKVIEEIRPYHGILIFNMKDVYSSLLDDYSPALSRFLSMHEATKSLQVLSSGTDLPLTQVYELASKLVYWGKAMVIYPMCDSNTYMTAPCADLSPFSEKLRVFFGKFNWDLREVLSHFSLPTRLSDLHQNPHEFFYGNEEKLIQVVFWLLQHRFLIQMHTYVFFSPDESHFVSDRNAAIPPGSLDEDLEYSLLSLSSEQRRAILATQASGAPKDLRLFLNLMKYFSGDYHLEEIMYNENMSRAQLLRVLDKFSPLLVTNLREDSTTAAFCM